MLQHRHARTIKKTHQCGYDAWTAIVLAFVLVGCGASGEDSLVQGEKLLRENKIPAAIEVLTQATKSLPHDWRAYNYLGMAYQRQGDYKKSKTQYNKALALVDQNPELVNQVNVVRYNLGRLYLDHGHPTLAAEKLAAYTMQAKDSYEGFFWRGTAEYLTGNKEQQPELLERAETSLRRAIELNVDSVPAFNRLGMVQMVRDKFVDARASFLRAHELDKHFAPAILNLAIVHESFSYEDVHKSLNQAFQYYMLYLNLAEEGSESWKMAQVAMNKLNLKLNLPLVAQVKPVVGAQPEPLLPVNSNPSQPLPPLTPSTFTVRVPIKGLGTNAVVPTAPTGPLRPTTVAPPVSLPDPSLTPETTKPVVPQQQPKEPVPVSPEAPEPSKPSQPVTPSPTAVAKNIEQPAKPIAPNSTLPPTLNINSDLPDLPNIARYQYIRPSRLQDGDRKKANEYFKKAKHAHGINRLTEAIAGYKKAVSEDPGYQQAYLNLALAAHQNGNIEEALRSYEMALKLNPLSVDARFNFAVALQRNNYHIDAARELQHLLEDTPNLLNAHLLLANLLSEHLRSPRRAKPHYAKVLQMNPGHTQAPDIRQWLIAHP